MRAKRESLLFGQRHIGVDPRKYKHDAQASVVARKGLTRLRFVLVWPTKVALPNYAAEKDDEFWAK
jgi:hypothetical protein